MSSNPIPFPRTNLEVEIEKLNDERVVVRCHGKLLHETCYKLTQAVKPFVATSKEILFDLKQTDEIDSSGVGALVALRVSAARHLLNSIGLCNLKPNVEELLRSTNVLQVFEDMADGGEPNGKEPVLDHRRHVEIEKLRRDPDLAAFSEED